MVSVDFPLSGAHQTRPGSQNRLGSTGKPLDRRFCCAVASKTSEIHTKPWHFIYFAVNMDSKGKESGQGVCTYKNDNCKKINQCKKVVVKTTKKN